MTPPAGPFRAGTTDQPVYDRLGGAGAIDAAVNAFHERVASDDRVNHYFQRVDMETLRRHQKEFFAAGTGGPVEYADGEIAAIHAPLAIDDRVFDLFAGHLEDTLLALDVPDRERGELLGLIEGYRPDVVRE